MADDSSRAGSGYLSPEILDFTNRTHASHDEGLAGAFEAPTEEGIPAIQVGPSEGKLLGLLMRMNGCKSIVEVGTLAGYSAIWLARGAGEDATVWTIESDPRHAKIARARIASAGLSERIHVLDGPGVEVLASLEDRGPFDAVFVDADKASYPAYGRWAAAHLRKGGLLIGDNAYLFGNLMDDSDTASAMRAFHVGTAADFDSVCIPTPDGLVVGIKR